MGSTPKPEPRNYGQETRDTLQAQVDLAPSLLKAEQQTRPGYTALELQTTNDALWGTGGADGLVAQYEKLSPRLSAMEQDSLNAQREGDISAVEKLGPRAIAALKETNPEAFALLEAMTQGARDDLAAGTGLTEGESRQVQQAVRAGQSARGLSLGPAEAYQEAVATNEYGNHRKQQRLANAAQAISLNQALMGDPFLQILGRPSSTFAQTSALSGQGQGVAGALGPQIFNPESQYSADLFQGNYEGDLAAKIATSSKRAGLLGGAIGGIGKLAGGFLAGSK